MEGVTGRAVIAKALTWEIPEFPHVIFFTKTFLWIFSFAYLRILNSGQKPNVAIDAGDLLSELTGPAMLTKDP